MSLLELFVNVDDFCQSFLAVWGKELISDGSQKRRRTGQVRISEIMMLIIYFQQCSIGISKSTILNRSANTCGEFPNLVPYERFVILMSSAFGSLSAYLKRLSGQCSGILFVDSTALEVCDR